METTTTTVNQKPTHSAGVNALAIVGFIVLIIIGILLAIYSVRLIPGFASRFGSASPFSSLFGNDGDDDPSLQVVTATSTLPTISTAVVAVSTTTTTTHTSGSAGATVSHTSNPAPVTTVTTITTVGPVPIDPNGQPDLQVTITDVGYLRHDGDTSSFVSEDSIDNDYDGGVKFTVKNIGTNVTGEWKFEAEVPSNPSRTYTSPTQRSMKPGETFEYVLGFEKPREGDNREITITVDSNHNVRESNENNNSDSEQVDIDN